MGTGKPAPVLKGSFLLPSCRSALREDTRGEFSEGEFSDAITRFAALRRKPCEWKISSSEWFFTPLPCRIICIGIIIRSYLKEGAPSFIGVRIISFYSISEVRFPSEINEHMRTEKKMTFTGNPRAARRTCHKFGSVSALQRLYYTLNANLWRREYNYSLWQQKISR